MTVLSDRNTIDIFISNTRYKWRQARVSCGASEETSGAPLVEPGNRDSDAIYLLSGVFECADQLILTEDLDIRSDSTRAVRKPAVDALFEAHYVLDCFSFDWHVNMAFGFLDFAMHAVHAFNHACLSVTNELEMHGRVSGCQLPGIIIDDNIGVWIKSFAVYIAPDFGLDRLTRRGACVDISLFALALARGLEGGVTTRGENSRKVLHGGKRLNE